MQQGAAQATAALRTVGDQARTAETSVSRVSNAFQATGGSLQVAQGITQVARAFQDANIAAAGFAGSRVLLELGRTAQDFAQLGGRVGLLATSFARLNPVLLIASTAMSAVSLGMSLFSDNASKATDRAGAFADAMERINAQTSVAQRFGDQSLLTAAFRARTRQIDEYAVQLENLASIQGTVSAREFGKATGLTYEDVLRRRDELLPFAERTPIDRLSEALSKEGGYDQRIGAYTGLDILGRYRQELLANPPSGAGTSTAGSVLPERGLQLTVTSAEKRALDEVAREMEELQQKARGVGEALGDGLTDVIFQLRSAREVLASMLQDISRTLIRNAIGNLTAGIVSSFGPTVTQQTTSTRIPGVNPSNQ